MAYFAYAHAMFCNRSDFDAHYGTKLGPAAYDRLRSLIARRYFHGGRGFDAATVVRLGTPTREEEYSFYQGVDG